MEYNQVSKLILKNLLKYGGAAIKKRAAQNSDNQTPDVTCQKNLLKVFSELLGEEFDIKSFEKNILKKRLFPITSAKVVIKSLYQFIYAIEINGARITEDEINNLSEDIKKQIMKLNRMSRFFGIKRPLCVKIDELTKIKNQCFGSFTSDMQSAVDFVRDATRFVGTMDVSDLQTLEKHLDLLNKYLSSADDDNSEFLSGLTSFFSSLRSKFDDCIRRIQNKEFDVKTKETVHKSAEEIISDLKISRTYFETKNQFPDELKKCIKNCEIIYELTEPIKQALKDLEEKNERKAYSFKSFKRVLDLHDEAVKRANELLTSKNFDPTVSCDALSEYRKMLENEDVRILKKEFYDRAVKKIKESVYKAIAEPKKQKSIFGDKKPDSNRVLNELLKALKSMLSGDEQKRLKNAFKTSKVNLLSATIEDIAPIISEAVEKNKFEASREAIKKVLNHRDISLNLNYKNLFIETLNEDKSSWKKIKKDITVKGKTLVEATLTSTPASELGYFRHLEQGHGLSSQQRESEHAINLWETKAQTKNGKVLFSGIRHGNTRGKETATKEIILAAATEQYGLENLRKSAPDKIWYVKLGNIQIMSSVGKLNPISPDKKMALKQMEAFNKIYEQGPFKIEIKDESGKPKEITLRLLKPILVNFGVNVQHFALGGHLVKSSYQQNKEAFIDLFGKNIIEKLEKRKKVLSASSIVGQSEFASVSSVGKYLDEIKNEMSEPKNQDRIEELALKKKKIINLSSQLLFIWQSTNGKGNKINPYATQTRLAALLYLIGYPVSFNCKSGKDRTGVLASEINDLILTMETNDGELPEPYKKLNEEEKLQARKVYAATQSDKITSFNTGYRGLKVGGTIEKRLGELRGASQNTSIDNLG